MKSNPFYLLDANIDEDNSDDDTKSNAQQLNKNEAVARVRKDTGEDQGGWSTKTKKSNTNKPKNQRGGQGKAQKSKQRKGRPEQYLVVNVKSIVGELHDHIAQARNMNGYRTNWINLWRKEYIWEIFFPSIQKNEFLLVGRDNLYKIVDFICFKAAITAELTNDLSAFKDTFGISDINVFNATLYIPKNEFFVNDQSVHKTLHNAWKANIPDDFKMDEALMFSVSVAPFVIEDGKVLVLAGESSINNIYENISGKFDFNKDSSFQDCAVRKFQEMTSVALDPELFERGYSWDFVYFNVIWRYYFIRVPSRDIFNLEEIEAYVNLPRKSGDIYSKYKWIDFDEMLEQASTHTMKCFNFKDESDETAVSNLEGLQAYLETQKEPSNDQ